MLFSSITFLNYFLPIVLLLYFIIPKKLKNLVLLIASLLFYFWGEPIYTFLMLGSILSGYIHGLLIERYRGTRASKIALISSLVVSLGLLGLFKYSDFFIESINGLFKTKFALLGLALPIGISFYTFQILSYTIDLYRGEISVQRNVLKLATYVSLFPQLIAGPIVRYSTVEKELENRTHNLDGFASGATRFVLGLSKKVLIANNMGQLVEIFKSSAEQSVLFFWMYGIAFALQLYFDFSGYSDMAIGLGRIFGFKFLENFNYPFISKSVTEFWRRWHISLGSWFRDYVYIPLGGSRTTTLKWVRNILIVWMLTGLWHGAGWTFVAWGLFFAVLLVLEKHVYGNALAKMPKFFAHVYTVFLIIISFMLFDSSTIKEALTRVGGLFGIGGYALYDTSALYYLRSYAMLVGIAIIGATPLPKWCVEKFRATRFGAKAIKVLIPLVVLVVLVLTTAYLVDGSFNPFIYFRF